MFETDKIKKRGHSHTLSFLLKLPRNSGVFFQKEGKEKKSSPSGSSFQVKFIWSSNEAHLILGRMYLKLRRDVSGAASGRNFGNSIGDYTGKTASKTPLKITKNA